MEAAVTVMSGACDVRRIIWKGDVTKYKVELDEAGRKKLGNLDSQKDG